MTCGKKILKIFFYLLQNFHAGFFVTDIVTFFSARIFCNRFFFQLNDTNQQLKIQKIILFLVKFCSFLVLPRAELFLDSKFFPNGYVRVGTPKTHGVFVVGKSADLF